MAMTTAEHILVVGAAAVGAAVVAPVAIPGALALVGAAGIATALGAWTGISLTGVGAGVLAGWGTHKYLGTAGKAST